MLILQDLCNLSVFGAALILTKKLDTHRIESRRCDFNPPWSPLDKKLIKDIVTKQAMRKYKAGLYRESARQLINGSFKLIVGLGINLDFYLSLRNRCSTTELRWHISTQIIPDY